eukprot:5990872-Amphidinium_carterae.3
MQLWKCWENAHVVPYQRQPDSSELLAQKHQHCLKLSLTEVTDKETCRKHRANYTTKTAPIASV